MGGQSPFYSHTYPNMPLTNMTFWQISKNICLTGTVKYYGMRAFLSIHGRPFSKIGTCLKIMTKNSISRAKTNKELTDILDPMQTLVSVIIRIISVIEKYLTKPNSLGDICEKLLSDPHVLFLVTWLCFWTD